nr:MAG TPA: hypothetical protein [Caudoviricetes sp.]
MIARWNNKDYRIIDSIEIKKSSREVTYTDLKLDFSKCTMEDLPYAQQEVQIIDKDGKLKFTGFVSDYKLPELKKIITPEKELNLSLYTPRQMTTIRTVTIMRTAMLSEIITQVLMPLYQDGFVLKTLHIEDRAVTLKLISKTVEEVLNYLSNKYSLYWNINEFKEIEIDDINYLFNKVPKKTINIKNYKQQINGFLSISPTVDNLDYANIINIKNARIFYDNIQQVNVTLKNGDRIDFENPIDISLATAERIVGALAVNQTTTCTNLELIYNGSSQAYIECGFNTDGEILPGVNTKDIATDDSTGALFVLTMDSTFKNLATGITYKGENTITVNSIRSQTFLRYANMKLINWQEIEQNEGKITTSGQIEKVLDVENGWFTVQELIDYIRNTFIINNKYTNQITIKYDKENNIEIGDRIDINLPEYFTEGIFIVTAINESKEGNNPTNYSVELRNTNLLENYIDLFRNSSDTEEQDSQIETEYVVEYSGEEKINEIHEIEMNEDYNDTLNTILRG